MSIVGADIEAFVAAHFLESGPEVRLEILDKVSDMYITVSVGQSGGGYNSPFFVHACNYKVRR